MISHEDVGHGNAGTRSLQIVWLEEVLALRVPAYIDSKGAPYLLRPVDPRTQGGHMYARLTEFQGRTIHTEVSVGPIGSIRNPSWWVPGPRTVGLIPEWVGKNDGVVVMDRSADVRRPINVQTGDKKLSPVATMIEHAKFNAALMAIDKFLAKCRDGKEDEHYVGALEFYKKLIEDWTAEHLSRLEKIKSTNDLYYLSKLLVSNKRIYQGIKSYDTAAKAYDAFLREKTSQDILTEGRKFYALIKAIGMKRSSAIIKNLKLFADNSPDTVYGKMAAAIHADLEKDPKAPINLQKYREV